jgi:predicted regulator of Ras-like GTPase activity (Roadblock/LC7/MglB family)
MISNFYSLSEETVNMITEEMQKLLESTNARCALLIDKSGYIIASEGSFSYLPAEDMGAIAAGSLGALSALVNIANSNEMTIEFHSKGIDTIYFALLNNRIFLNILYDSSTTKKKIRDASKIFVKTVQPLLDKDATQTIKLQSVEFIEEKLSELFKEEEQEQDVDR